MWNVYPPLSDIQRSVFVAAGYSPLVAQLLFNRDLASPDEARNFLSKDPLSHDPMNLPYMDKAVARIQKALENKERIAVLGDFDVDGLTATAILARAFKLFGVEISPYIPDRVEEGHGLTDQAIEELVRRNINLLITVDCGVTSHREIAVATAAHIDTIVTDHHLAPDGPPAAVAVVDPRLPGSVYPFPGLTGAGLALKLSQALYNYLGVRNSRVEAQLLTLAALGTVADVGPMIDENRSIVREGLEAMRQFPIPGIRALMRAAGSEKQIPDAETIGWVIAPRLNSAGRLGDAKISYQLLVSESEEEVAVIANSLEEMNRQRRSLTVEAEKKAMSLLDLDSLLMVSDASFTPGIIGLVAARLVDQFQRPAVAVSLGEDVSRGSCRSIPSFDIAGALHEVAPTMKGFIRYGGHSQAAGFTIETSQLPTLKEKLIALANNTLEGEVLQPRLNIDLDVPLSGLPRDIYNITKEFAPFGSTNPRPTFLSRDVKIRQVWAFGKNKDHLKFKLIDNGVVWDAVAFRQAANFSYRANAVDIVYSIGIDDWGGGDKLRLNILDVRAAG